MSRPFLTGPALILQRALAPCMGNLTYQPNVGAQYTAKLATGVPTGSTAVTLNTLQAGLAAVSTGDSFTISPYSAKETISAPATVSAGTLALHFTPATTGTTSTGAAVTITRVIIFTVKGAVVGFDQSAAINTALVTATTVKLLIDARTMTYNGSAIKPGVGDKVTLASGRIVTVSAVSLDVASAFYTLLAA